MRGRGQNLAESVLAPETFQLEEKHDKARAAGLRQQLAGARFPVAVLLFLLAVFSFCPRGDSSTYTPVEQAPRISARDEKKMQDAIKKEAKLVRDHEDVLAKEGQLMKVGDWSEVAKQRKKEHHLGKQEQKEIHKFQKHDHKDQQPSSYDRDLERQWDELEVRRAAVVLHHAVIDEKFRAHEKAAKEKHGKKQKKKGATKEQDQARKEGKLFKEEETLEAQEKEALDDVERKLKQQAQSLAAEEKAIDKSIAHGKMHHGTVAKMLRKEHELAASVEGHMQRFHKAEGKEEKKEASLVVEVGKHAGKRSDKQDERHKKLKEAGASLKEKAQKAEAQEAKLLSYQTELEKKLNSTEGGTKELQKETDRLNGEKERRLVEEEEKLQVKEKASLKQEGKLLKDHTKLLQKFGKVVASGHLNKKDKALEKKVHKLAKEEQKQVDRLHKLQSQRLQKKEEFEKLMSFANDKQKRRHKKVLDEEGALHDRLGKVEATHSEMATREAHLEDKLASLRLKR